MTTVRGDSNSDQVSGGWICREICHAAFTQASLICFLKISKIQGACLKAFCSIQNYSNQIRKKHFVVSIISRFDLWSSQLM